MSIEKMLIEYAKLHLQLITANEQIALLQAQIADLNKSKAEETDVKTPI